MMILTFEDDEKELYMNILNYVGNKMEAVQITDVSKSRKQYGELEVDLSRRTLLKRKIEIELTFTEFEIFILLAESPGRVFSKESIYDKVWKEPYLGDYNIVMSHIRNIRKKIEDNPSKPIYIQTVWGVGYRFNKNLSSGL
ncbi:winged helix-turn-helix domain-containing protein [Thermoguttaceae bacterium LCP21S3_D4]